MQRHTMYVTGLILFPLGWGVGEWRQMAIYIQYEFHPREDQKAFDTPKRAAYRSWSVPSGLALSLEIVLCLHADQLIFFPGWVLTSHLFTEDTSRANFQHLPQRLHSLKEIHAEFIYAYYRANVLL